MRFCDLTLSYTETSGGIRTYLDQKRRYLLEEILHEHVRPEYRRGDGRFLKRSLDDIVPDANNRIGVVGRPERGEFHDVIDTCRLGRGDCVLL